MKFISKKYISFNNGAAFFKRLSVIIASIFLVLISPVSSSYSDALNHFTQQNESQHFTVFYSKKEAAIAPQVIEYAEKSYSEIASLFPEINIPKVKIIIYSSVSDYNRISGQKAPNWVKGKYSREKIILLNPYMNLWNRLFRKVSPKLIKHELSHVFIIHKTSRLPNWLNEGLAQYIAEDGYKDKNAFIKAIKKDKILPLSAIDMDFGQLDNNEKVKLAYAESLSVIEYMVDTYGFNKVKEFLLLMGKGSGYTLEYSLQNVFSISCKEFEDGWKKYLKERFLR